VKVKRKKQQQYIEAKERCGKRSFEGGAPEEAPPNNMNNKKPVPLLFQPPQPLNASGVLGTKNHQQN